MSDSVKSPSASHPVAGRGNLYRAAIVGAASLRGKEVAEMLNERNFPAADIRLLDDDESLGQRGSLGDRLGADVHHFRLAGFVEMSETRGHGGIIGDKFETRNSPGGP